LLSDAEISGLRSQISIFDLAEPELQGVAKSNRAYAVSSDM
jgi:hypothetical protein